LVIYNTYLVNNIALPTHLANLTPFLLGLNLPNDVNRVMHDAMIYDHLLLNYQFYPWRKGDRASFYQQHLGIYVPKGYLLPLGDNRDDSKDGRYWGVVKQNKVLGKALFRFFPFDGRFGALS
jgi:signal peptidase I